MSRFYAFVLGGMVACGCIEALTPAETVELGDTAAIIAHCQALGLACKVDGGSNCYKSYDDCMKDAGLHE